MQGRGSGERLDLTGRRVLIVGFATTGVSLARRLGACGALVRVFDSRPAAEFHTPLRELPVAVEEYFQARPRDALRDVDLVVTSPGVPASSELLREAGRIGLPVWSEIEVAYRQLAAPLVAVTGTNGKSTTVCLIGEMLEKAGLRTFVGGNLGSPLVEAAQGNFDCVVAEVSSFQLEWIVRFRPRVGVILNVSEDHLDRHNDMETYGRTKLRVMQNQRDGDVTVINRDDEWLSRHVRGASGRLISFGRNRVEEGAFVRGGRIVIAGRGGKEEYSLTGFRPLGSHNRANAMAAALAVRSLGVPPHAVQEGLESFRGLDHRMEFVRDRHGVAYIDDSKATNVDAVVQALASCSGPVILLAGGRGKGSDFHRLREPARGCVRLMLVFGESAERIAAAVAGGVPVEVVEDLPGALARAARAAVAGDTVLLSPACASFDQYRDYKDRGNEFKGLVALL